MTPRGHESAEALPGRTGEGQRDGVVGQSRRPVAPADLRAEQRPHRAVDVGDGEVDGHRGPVGQGRRALVEEGVVECLLQPMVLPPQLAPAHGVGHVGLRQHGGQVQAGGLPVGDRRVGVQQIGAADGLVEGVQAERGQVLADLLGDVLEEGLDELGLAVELGPQRRRLRRDADGTGVEVADPHHDAARDHQRCRGEAVLFCAEQRADDDVATGLQLPVDLHHDAVAQAVHEEGLLRLGQADLPRDAGVLQRRQGRGARAPVVARDQHDVGVRLGHTGRHRAHTDLGHQLHVHACRGGWRT